MVVTIATAPQNGQGSNSVLSLFTPVASLFEAVNVELEYFICAHSRAKAWRFIILSFPRSAVLAKEAVTPNRPFQRRVFGEQTFIVRFLDI